MAKITTLMFLFQRPSFYLHFRLSQPFLFAERYFSTKNDGSDDENLKNMDRNSKKGLHTKETQSSKKISKTKPEQHALSNEEKEAAKKKLFALLSEMTNVPISKTKAGENLKLARPVKRISKQERFKEEIEKHREMQKSPEDKLQDAAKVVASSVKGDAQQTLAELNEKLRKLNLSSQAQQPPEAESEMILDEETNKNFMSSVKDIAATVADGSAPKSKLAERLLKISTEEKSSGFKMPLNELIKGMNIEKQVPGDKRKQEFESTDVQKREPRQSVMTKFRIDIFNAAPLNIFKVPEEPITDTKKTVWQTLEEKNLKLLTQFAPANGFEEMIMWTEQGKHWKFPIDNQIELGGEENVGFHEHVFLEQHLHGFPTKGPIRHFMELVVVGLSKNPYISVERKIENIDWFREYFKEKEDILQATGALG